MFYAMDDDDYWDRWPEHLRPMGELTTAMGAQNTLFALGNPFDESTPAAAILKMPPNWVLARHAHTSERIEVIIAGTLDVGGRVLGPGAVMVAGSEEAYGPHVTGPDGCTTVEIFATLAGAHRALFETPDGMQPIDLAGPDARRMIEQANDGEN